MISKKMILVSGSGDTVVWFRLEFLKKFLDKSYKVYVLAPDIREDLKPVLLDLGVEFIYIKLNRKGFNVINLLKSIREISTIFQSLHPDIIFSYTHKAILASSIAARISGYRNMFSLITGTGHIFDDHTSQEKLIKSIGSLALRAALHFNRLVFFQNPDDKFLFESQHITHPRKTRLVNGSGVNLDTFKVTQLPEQPIFLCMARLIKSKGIIEFARAAKIVRDSYPNARFLLYGYSDIHVDSIDENEIMNEWKVRYGVEYMGYSSNPFQTIAQSSIFVLLSYKEGTPRVVLEAMAMGRPIITTDTPGCRETVKDNLSGFLVPKGDHLQAASAMISLIDRDLREKMGAEARKYCESKYNVHMVNDTLFHEMKVS
ncbi:glycosyltransferase family 4 protein [Gammaproteobacteria bacterium]|nr:glycosyltransferase family 4 protein [Gammaproteobacteria bacterium]